MKNWLKKNKLTIKGFAKIIGCCHVVISKVCNNKCITESMAAKIIQMTKGEVSPSTRERGRKVGVKVGKQKCKHSMSHTRENQIWSRMRRSCYNENFCQYKSYGKVGVTICKEWDEFLNFMKDMGPMPSGYKSMLLDNGAEQFNKENCKWVKDARGIRRNALKKDLNMKKAESHSEPIGRDGRPLQMSFDENMIIT